MLKNYMNVEMSSQGGQPFEEQRSLIIQIIEEYLAKISTFAKLCDQEAQRSSLTKRKARWINGVGGGLIVLMGLTISAMNDNEKIRKYVGIASTAVGSVIATAGQFIDPAKARQRAIDLKNLGLKLEVLETESKVTYVGLKSSGTEVEPLIALNKKLLNDFAALRKEAYDLGVEV
jgi:hypothetical protein